MESIIGTMRYLLPLVLCGAFAAEPALAAKIPSFVKKEVSYSNQLRARLAKAGWTPADISKRQPANCPDYDERCATYPEARECSGTGLGFCNMVWTHKDGTRLVITTAGEGEEPSIFGFEIEK